MKIEFTINTTRYESNARQTYFYATENVGTDKLMIKRRISKADFEAAQSKYEQECKAAELDTAAENPEVTLEQFVELVQEAEESANTEAGKEIVEELAPAIMTISRECGDDVEIMETTKDRLISRDRFEFFRKPEWDKNGTKAFAMRDSLMPYALYLTKEQYETLFPSKKAPKAKKERKPRKSKDIAYDGHGVTLTAKQVDFIKHLSDTCFWERGLDSCIWCDVLADEIGGQFAGKPMTTGAMLSTICEKGLGSRCKDRINGRKCTSFALTELGKIVAAELGLH